MTLLTDDISRSTHSAPAMPPAMPSPRVLNESLASIADHGTLVADDGTRQVWTFHAGDAPLRLHFYPGTSSPAAKEFYLLQQLRKQGLPVVRPSALLQGFKLGGGKGDAVLLPADAGLDAGVDASRRSPVDGVIATLVLLHAGGYGHDALRPDCFDTDGRLSDGRGLVRGGLTADHLFTLAHHTGPTLSRTDRLRGWRILHENDPLPRRNPRSLTLLRPMLRRCVRANADFAAISVDGWTGFAPRRAVLPQVHSPQSRDPMPIARWAEHLPTLLGEQLTPIKRDPGAGDVSAATIDGVDVIVKRPHRKNLGKAVADTIRDSRGMRTWKRTWRGIAAGLPCERPMLLLQRKRFGYVVEELLVFERVPGPTLLQLGPDVSPALAARCRRWLAYLESLGLTHADAKTSNWIAWNDDTPVMLDCDGIKPGLPGPGFERFERALREQGVG
ncbi:MAG: hypothetical protein AAF743_00550 [Planctomycetota bacterium]